MVKKILVLLFLFIIFVLKILAQDNYKYFYYTQIGKYYFERNNNNKSLYFYSKIDKVNHNFMNYDDYIVAAKNAYLIKSHKKFNYFISQAFKNGFTFEEIEEDSLLSYIVAHEKVNVKKKYHLYEDNYKSQLNFGLCNRINYLFSLDQFLREQDDNVRIKAGLLPLNLKFDEKRAKLPPNYQPKFDIDSFLNYINNNNDINYIF